MNCDTLILPAAGLSFLGHQGVVSFSGILINPDMVSQAKPKMCETSAHSGAIHPNKHHCLDRSYEHLAAGLCQILEKHYTCTWY